jgi:vancomycin resistance protein VanW
MLTAVRKALRRWVPVPLRRGVAIARRTLRDRLAGNHLRIARSVTASDDRPCAVAIDQPIMKSLFWEGKLANLQRGSALIDGLRVAPGEIFSFWALIGAPTAAKGFAVGRAIQADQETGDIGGGLCQLSGIIYELGLLGGLTVVERHAHSRDLYHSDDERYTPLGLDATVVWPWKDLRLENRLGVPVVLRFTVEGMVLMACMQADDGLPQQPLKLVREDQADHRTVTVWRGGEVVSRDRYAI